MKRFNTPTEDHIFTLDVDTPEGREGLKEAFGAYELDAKTWLPFAAKTYHISPNIEDYVITVTPICPSDIPNRNGIAFPIGELVKFQPPPVARQVFKAWAGVPVHLEHNNSDCTQALGAVLDSSLHKIKGYGGGKLWKVMGLAATDKTKFPEIAQKQLLGEYKTFSMGADGGYFTCSYCGTRMEPNNHCEHLNPRNAVDWTVVTEFDGSQHLAFRNAHDLIPIELSVVADPAWSTALSDTILPQITNYRR